MILYRDTAHKPLGSSSPKTRNPDRHSPKRGVNHEEHHKVMRPRLPRHGFITFWVYRARACMFGRRAGGQVCASTAQEQAGQRQTQAGESSWLTEKRRTLMGRLSITVDLRQMWTVSKT